MPVDRTLLRSIIEAAKSHAPEVATAEGALQSSRAALENGRVAPFGNPSLEITGERADKGVVQDVAVSASVWLPIEISGQKDARKQEAGNFVALHTALVTTARARAAGHAVRAYGSLLVAQARASVLTELLTNARAEARMLAERMASGDATQRDVALADVEAARHDMLVDENDAELARARGELSEVLGSLPVTGIEQLAPPASAGAPRGQTHVATVPQAQALLAEARLYNSSAERARREGLSMLSVGLVGGRGDFGETRLGAGLGYALPIFRSNRPERARATAEAARLLDERDLVQTLAARRLGTLRERRVHVDRAIAELTEVALPAARRAVDSVQATYEAGKSELMSVLLTRRELSTLALRRLDLLEKSWALLSECVEITGDLP